MEDLIKKVSYIKGYADGLELSADSCEGKLILKMLDVMNEMAETIEKLNIRLDDAEENIDILEQCLDDIGDEMFDGYDIDDDDSEYDDGFFDDDDDDYDDIGSDYFEIQCPNCGEDVMIDFDMIDDNNDIVCPNCGEEIELEFDCGCDDDDCGHEH